MGCILIKAVLLWQLIIITGLLIFCGKKSKISRDFQGQIRGQIGRFHGIFAGEESKFAEKLADFVGFSGKKSNFEGFSGANS